MAVSRTLSVIELSKGIYQELSYMLAIRLRDGKLGEIECFGFCNIETGKIEPLTPDKIEVCKSLGLDYVLIEEPIVPAKPFRPCQPEKEIVSRVPTLACGLGIADLGVNIHYTKEHSLAIQFVNEKAQCFGVYCPSKRVIEPLTPDKIVLCESLNLEYVVEAEPLSLKGHPPYCWIVEVSPTWKPHPDVSAENRTKCEKLIKDVAFWLLTKPGDVRNDADRDWTSRFDFDLDRFIEVCTNRLCHWLLDPTNAEIFEDEFFEGEIFNFLGEIFPTVACLHDSSAMKDRFVPQIRKLFAALHE